MQFSYRLAESTQGRVFFRGGRDLDRFMIWDSMRRRRVLVALNKVDLLSEPEKAQRIAIQYPKAVAISALYGWGLDDLLAIIESMLAQQMARVRVHIPYAANGLVALFHKRGVIVHEHHGQTGITIEGKLPSNLMSRFEPYLA